MAQPSAEFSARRSIATRRPKRRPARSISRAIAPLFQNGTLSPSKSSAGDFLSPLSPFHCFSLKDTPGHFADEGVDTASVYSPVSHFHAFPDLIADTAAKRSPRNTSFHAAAPFWAVSCIRIRE
jgi:hypothetical protein